MPPARRPGHRRWSPASGRQSRPTGAGPPRIARSVRYPTRPPSQRAHPARREPGRTDAERDVESGPQVAERDDVSESDELRGVELRAQGVEQLVTHLDRG